MEVKTTFQSAKDVRSEGQWHKLVVAYDLSKLGDTLAN